jgi:hypothetical protein
VDDDQNEALLAEAVRAFRRLPKGISVSQIISAVTEHSVVPLEDCAEDRGLIDRVSAACINLIARSQATPIKTTRLNELGNAVEEPMLEACRRAGLEASWPRRADGAASRTGYPDIAIGIDGQHPTYLEVKVIGVGSETSSFRSFYLSPSDNPKVCKDARHILVAFTHQRATDANDGLEQYSLTKFKIVDLARVIGKINSNIKPATETCMLETQLLVEDRSIVLSRT